jgi:hypothetical protein
MHGKYLSSHTGEPLLTNIAGANKSRLPDHLTSTEHRAYEQFNKLTLKNVKIYLMEKINSTYEHSTYKHILKKTLCL